MAPYPVTELLGKWGAYALYLLIGFAFGYVLEIAGFGNALKLARQFYFKEQTVLKVMFTAIVTAMVLIFLASGLGWLDYNLIWVNPTYLWPGIVGGLIMGFGFIIGGFCPGTSLVAAATLKLDGIFFALGTFFGIFLFGETVAYFEDFWHASYLGRFTLPEWLGLPTGVVVVLVVGMALFMFWGAEQLERIFGQANPRQAPRWRYGAAGVLGAAALATLIIGQPTSADRWMTMAAEKEVLLAERAVHIHPGELLQLIHDAQINLILLDVRPEVDYNLFHLLDAQHAPLATLSARAPDLLFEPPNSVVVVMSNDEAAAVEGWKLLTAESVPNVYILEGGLNNWLTLMTDDAFKAAHPQRPAGPDELRYTFPAALGSRITPANPNPELHELEYTPKVQLKTRRGATGGGCG